MYPVGTRLITTTNISIPLDDTGGVPAGMHGTVEGDYDDEGYIVVKFDQPIEAIEHWRNRLVVEYGNIGSQFKLEEIHIEECKAEAHDSAAQDHRNRAAYLAGEEDDDEPEAEAA
jgi:hypothetical protein